MSRPFARHGPSSPAHIRVPILALQRSMEAAIVILTMGGVPSKPGFAFKGKLLLSTHSEVAKLDQLLRSKKLTRPQVFAKPDPQINAFVRGVTAAGTLTAHQ